MSTESPLPPVPPSAQQPSSVAPMSNALGICALVFTLTGCCSFVGLILGIIGICKYPEGSAGRVLSIIATVIAVIIHSGAYLYDDTILRYYHF